VQLIVEKRKEKKGGIFFARTAVRAIRARARARARYQQLLMTE
jgi:hypothetical protein